MDAFRQTVEDVRLLLQSLESKKRLVAGTKAAQAHAADAELLLEKVKNSKLLEPHRSILFYRIALLKLRALSLSLEDLEDIDQYLARASAEESLGPWPRLYRLAVLQRISSQGKLRVMTIENAFEAARQAVSRYLTLHASDSGLLEGSKTLQHELFNTLELSAFFIGIDYQCLDGMGTRLSDPYAVPPGEPCWKVLGVGWPKSDLAYPYAIASRELKSWSEEVLQQGRRALFFELGSKKSNWHFTKISLSPPPEHALKILLGILRFPEYADKDVADVFGLGSDQFKTIKSRTRKLLVEAGALNSSQSLVDLEIYGAVEEQFLAVT